MKISARNVLAGTVTKVLKGAVNAEVDLTLQGGEKMAAIITNSSVDNLGLKEGVSAFAIIKSSEVMIGRDVEKARLSARNVLAGEIATIHDGAVNSEVVVKLPGGSEVVASITKASAASLELKPGVKASAIIKASNVMIGVQHTSHGQ